MRDVQPAVQITLEYQEKQKGHSFKPEINDVSVSSHVSWADKSTSQVIER